MFVRIINENGKFYYPPDETVYLELKMVEKFYNMPFKIVKIKGRFYYHLQIEAFDHLGIFTFSIRHKRLGYYFLEQSKNIVFKYYYDPEKRFFLFSKEAFPFWLIGFGVHISALIVLFVGLSQQVYYEEKQITKKIDSNKDSEKKKLLSEIDNQKKIKENLSDKPHKNKDKIRKKKRRK